MVLLYMVYTMDPINKNPSHVSINIPAPAGSVMGNYNATTPYVGVWSG